MSSLSGIFMGSVHESPAAPKRGAQRFLLNLTYLKYHAVLQSAPPLAANADQFTPTLKFDLSPGNPSIFNWTRWYN